MGSGAHEIVFFFQLDVGGPEQQLSPAARRYRLSVHVSRSVALFEFFVQLEGHGLQSGGGSRPADHSPVVRLRDDPHFSTCLHRNRYVFLIHQLRRQDVFFIKRGFAERRPPAFNFKSNDEYLCFLRRAEGQAIAPTIDKRKFDQPDK